jgi:hypothetical protein
MSHFTTVQTKLTDFVAIKQAVEDLGMTYLETEEPVMVRGYQGAAVKAPLVIRAGDHYDVGVRETEEGYEFVADWWGIEVETGLNQEQFVNQITQRYAYHKVVNSVKNQGFTLEEETVKDDEIRLTVRKWTT